MKETLLVVKDKTPFCDAIEEVHRRKSAAFAVDSQGEIYLVTADAVIEQGFQKALAEKPDDPATQQFEILRGLYRSKEPVLTALRSSQIWPRRLPLTDTQGYDASTTIREVKLRRWDVPDELVVPREISILRPLELPQPTTQGAGIVFPQELKFLEDDELDDGDSSFRGSGEGFRQIEMAYFYVWQCASGLHTASGVGPNPGLCSNNQPFRRVKIQL